MARRKELLALYCISGAGGLRAPPRKLLGGCGVCRERAGGGCAERSENEYLYSVAWSEWLELHGRVLSGLRRWESCLE